MAKYEMFHNGVLVSRYINRGPAADGSGTLFMHQQFRTASDGRQIVFLSEATCLTAAQEKQLSEVPGVVFTPCPPGVTVWQPGLAFQEAEIQSALDFGKTAEQHLRG